jgi:hypothetical protein
MVRRDSIVVASLKSDLEQLSFCLFPDRCQVLKPGIPVLDIFRGEEELV